MMLRGDRRRRILGRPAGSGDAARGDPGRARPCDRRRAAPLGRVEPRRARVAAAAPHRPSRLRARRQGAARARHVYVAPADYHLLVDERHFALSVDARVQFARPSIDVLFESVARAYRDRAIGIVLDGRERGRRRRAGGDQAQRRRLDRPGPDDGGEARDAGRRDRGLRRRRGAAARADSRLSSTACAARERIGDRRRPRQAPARRRPAREPARAGGDPRAARDRSRSGVLGRGGAPPAAARGVRGDPARRPDARHRRLRDRGADQAARADAPRADHLPDRDLEGRGAHLPRLQRRRRRLPAEAVRPADSPRQGRGLHRPVAEDGGDPAPRRPARRAGACCRRARERGALPLARRRRAADRLDDRRRRAHALLQRALVRVHRDEPRRAELGARLHPSRGRADDARALGVREGERDDVRDRVPAAASRRRLPLAPRARGRRAGRHGRVDRLGRDGHRHRGPQARRGPAGVPRRGGLGARQLARLRGDARGRRAPRRPPRRRLVRGRHLRRRHAGAARARARRSTQARTRPRARGADAVGGDGGDADDRARARDGGRRARAGGLPLQRRPARDRPHARAQVVRDGAAHSPRRGLRLDHARHGRVGPRLRRGGPRAGRRARAACGGGDRQRTAVRGVRAAQPGGARARGRRRRRGAGRPRRHHPPLEHSGDHDHRALRGRGARAADRGRRAPLARALTVDPRCRQARRAGPGRDGPGRVRRPRALDLGLRRRLRGGHRLRISRPDRGAGARVAEGRLRRHGLPRAAHAAGGDLRVGADDPAHGHRARPRHPRPAAERDRVRVGPARHDRQRPPRGRQARRQPAADRGGAVRPGGAGRGSGGGRRGPTCRKASSSSWPSPRGSCRSSPTPASCTRCSRT